MYEYLKNRRIRNRENSTANAFIVENKRISIAVLIASNFSGGGVGRAGFFPPKANLIYAARIQKLFFFYLGGGRVAGAIRKNDAFRFVHDKSSHSLRKKL